MTECTLCVHNEGDRAFNGAQLKENAINPDFVCRFLLSRTEELVRTSNKIEEKLSSYVPTFSTSAVVASAAIAFLKAGRGAGSYSSSGSYI